MDCTQGKVRWMALALALAVGPAAPSRLRADDDLYRQLRPLMESMAIIQDNYVDADKVKSKDLVNGAIKGMMERLDPFSQYMDPTAAKDMDAETQGSFGGLGIEISMRAKLLTVISPIEDTPADKAGIKSGDSILKINGESTEGMDIMDAVHRMRGKPGTPVTITIYRPGFEAPKDVTIVRAIIKIQTVKSSMLPGRVGYIRLTEFMGDCSGQFTTALDALRREGARSLIVDVRNNPGGKLDSAAEIAGHFVPRGKVIVSTAARYKDKDMSLTSDGTDRWKGPAVILINGGSASASEILAGALQDYRLAVVVGTRSFGKGSVQTILKLSNGGALRLTTAKYLTPKGRTLHGKGITPDVVFPESYPSRAVEGLAAKDRFKGFAKAFLIEHPHYSLRPVSPRAAVNVSESDWQVLKPESKDDLLLDAFQAYLDKHGKRLDQEDIVRDRTQILHSLKVELATRISGKAAAHALTLTYDPQIAEAMDVLKVERIARTGAKGGWRW